MNIFKKSIILAAVAGLSISAAFPVTASAASKYYGHIGDFASDYSYDKRTFKKTDVNGTAYDVTVSGDLSGINKCSTKVSTTTGDHKTAYVCEWNKNGTAKSASNSSTNAKVANLYATINASFFLPTHTYHEGYSKQCDSYLCYWLY